MSSEFSVSYAVLHPTVNLTLEFERLALSKHREGYSVLAWFLTDDASIGIYFIQPVSDDGEMFTGDRGYTMNVNEQAYKLSGVYVVAPWQVILFNPYRGNNAAIGDDFCIVRLAEEYCGMSIGDPVEFYNIDGMEKPLGSAVVTGVKRCALSVVSEHDCKLTRIHGVTNADVLSRWLSRYYEFPRLLKDVEVTVIYFRMSTSMPSSTHMSFMDRLVKKLLPGRIQ